MHAVSKKRAAGWKTHCDHAHPLDSFPARSEEHTSELQSHSDLVCRLLLEKKKYHSFLCSSRLYSRTAAFSQLSHNRRGAPPLTTKMTMHRVATATSRN